MIPAVMKSCVKRIIPLLFLLPALSQATPYYGANFSYLLIAKEPPGMKAYQLMLTYDPQRFQWRQFNIYFDGGFSHLWEMESCDHTSVNIYSIAPVIRYTFRKRGPIHPYLELSIGLAYLNHTRFEERNMGMHFSFQDRMGIGALLGEGENISVGIHAVHYSNAKLCSHNSGITIPLALDIGYRFN